MSWWLGSSPTQLFASWQCIACLWHRSIRSFSPGAGLHLAGCGRAARHLPGEVPQDMALQVATG